MALPNTVISKPIVTPIEEVGPYGLQSQMQTGFLGVRDQLSSSHPLETSERNIRMNSFLRDCSMLRSIQGLHAPIRILAERRAASQIGRLPFLPSSRLMLDVLDGNDITIDIQDIYGGDDFAEVVGRPHNIVEKEYKIL